MQDETGETRKPFGCNNLSRVGAAGIEPATSTV